MEQLTQYAKSLEALLQRDTRYPLQAYGFAMAVLNDTVSRLPKARHISGQELAEGFRHFALEQFGPMTLAVMDAWNLHSTEDVGNLVFNLIEIGLLSKTADDRLEDFHQIYTFQEAFGGSYRYLQDSST